jgi:hypothetical protein
MATTDMFNSALRQDASGIVVDIVKRYHAMALGCIRRLADQIVQNHGANTTAQVAGDMKNFQHVQRLSDCF